MSAGTGACSEQATAPPARRAGRRPHRRRTSTSAKRGPAWRSGCGHITAKHGNGDREVTGGGNVDEDLIQGVKDGDPLAAAWLVSLYGSKLLGYCRTVAPDMGDADREGICEIAVETALRKIDDFDPARGSLQGWLRGFVRNGVLSWRRSVGWRLAPHSDEPEPPAQLRHAVA